MNSIATIQGSGAMVRAGEIRDTLIDNLGGEGVSIYELDTIKVPAGGGTLWTVTTVDGEKGMKEIEGVVVAKTMTRTYWAKSMEEGGDGSPDCRSLDTIRGEKLTSDGPGGECAGCMMAEFGSSSKGKGQACKLQMHLAIRIGDDMLPTMLTIPPSGLKAAKAEWLIRLAKVNKPFWSCVTAIGLKQEVNDAGIKYSKPSFRIVRMLTEAEIAETAAYVEAMKGVLRTGGAAVR